MEHRYSHRIPATLWAELRWAELPVITALTRDICKDGVFLRFTHPKLRQNQILQLALYSPDGRIRWQTRAIVVHVSQRGAGVLLAEGLEGLYQAAVAAGANRPRAADGAGSIRNQGGVTC